MNKKLYILLFFIVLKFCLQYWLINPEYELHRDEFLHLDQGNHLSWGYLSVPPFTSWVAYLIKLLGNSIFWVRFFPALFGALTILVVWKTIEELKGGFAALILGATGVLFSVLLKLNILFQPNSMDVLCWTTFYYLLIKYFNTGNSKWLYAIALIFGIGFLNKYNIAFLLIGLVPAILISPQRRIFLRPQIYYAAIIGIIIILPNLYWQYANNFPVFHHLKELKETQLINVKPADFLKPQLLFFLGSLPVILIGFYALLFYPPFKKYRFFFWSFCFTMGVFLYFKAKDYYAIGVYPVYIAFGAAYLDQMLKNKWKIVLMSVGFALPVLYFILLYQFAFPNKSPEYMVEHSETYKKMGMLRWEDGKDHSLPQDIADMQGWKELATKTDQALSYIKNPGETLILCDNYGQAGAINFYSVKGIKAVSFNADYINWIDLNKPYKNFIRIKEYEGSRTEMQETGPYFLRSALFGTIASPFAREYGTSIFVFEGAKVNINTRIRDEIKNRR